MRRQSQARYPVPVARKPRRRRSLSRPLIRSPPIPFLIPPSPPLSLPPPSHSRQNDGVSEERFAAMLRRQEAEQVRRAAVARGRPPRERGDGGVGGDGDEDTVVAAGYTGARRYARLRDLRRRR